MEERLQKYMARCGVASRRKCEEIILAGRVQVDGVVVTELGIKVDGNVSTVLVDNNEIKLEEVKRYIMLNKPEGYVTTVKDEKNRQTILDIVNVDERVYPIGRLDYDSSGLLLLTNDGDIYNNIIHPRSVISKVYIALVEGIFTDAEMSKFKSGVDIGGYITSDSNIEVIKTMRDACEVKISIHEGKNRQIRKMCLALGHEVISLKRTAIGKLTLKDLEKGQWRELSLDEVSYIKNL